MESALKRIAGHIIFSEDGGERPDMDHVLAIVAWGLQIPPNLELQDLKKAIKH